MDESSKEKLEQELKFLKESFEAEVISREEYEKGKERIEKKLQGNGNGDNGGFFESENSNKKEPEKGPEEKKEEIKEDTKEKLNEPEEAGQIIGVKVEKSQDKKDSKIFRYAVVFAVLTLMIFFGYSLLIKNDQGNNEKKIQLTPICSSNSDCVQGGKQGNCENAGDISAKCQYPEIIKTKVTVLNDRKNCFNCDTQRILGIIENWFGDLDVTEIDLNSAQGKEFADKFVVDVLPAYILENISDKPAYSQIKQTFIVKEGSFLLSESAAASPFYFRRENMPNKLDAFIKEGDSASIKAEKNLEEFLDNFPNAEFEKHSPADDLAKELGINVFPAFLVNNRVKFTGVHPAEIIKDNFCSLNKIDECDKELQSNLVE